MPMICGVGGKGFGNWRAFSGAVQSLREETTTLPATATVKDTTKMPSRFGLNLGLGLRSTGLLEPIIRWFACGTFLSRGKFRTVSRDFQLLDRRLRRI